MDKNKSSEQMEYEERLRRRIKILKQEFEAGKVKIAEGLDVEKSLLAVKTNADGEVDLNTVDGVVRSLALGVTMMHDREEMKREISLHEIQNIYFKFLEDNFGTYYKIMCERGLTPHDVATVASKNENSIKNFIKGMEGFLNAIEEFWDNAGEVAHIHVEDMHKNVKGIFGGDLFPQHDENIASKCGIYTDTIILPDPFLRSKYIFQHMNLKKKVYYLMKHAMNLLQYKDLACVDFDIPIVVVLPDMTVLEQEEHEFLQVLGENDSLIHAKKLFGRDFSSFEEILDFGKSLDTIEKAVAEIKDNTRVLFDPEWGNDASLQIKNALKSDQGKFYKDITPGTLLARQALGRMSVSNEILIRSRRLRGTPIIDAPTSWQYLVWKMEYDAGVAEENFKTPGLHIVKGLGDLAHSDMPWIGNIPSDALIEIRKAGAMDEIRDILGKNINDLISTNPTNFYRTKDQIFENINEAFIKHQENIKTLRSKQWKFAGQDIGSWLVTGSIEVAAALTGTPVWGLATVAANQIFDTPKLKEIPKSIRELAEENKKLNQSPVGMLFSISKKSKK